jgi:hypothetical protein
MLAGQGKLIVKKTVDVSDIYPTIGAGIYPTIGAGAILAPSHSEETSVPDQRDFMADPDPACSLTADPDSVQADTVLLTLKGLEVPDPHDSIMDTDLDILRIL